MSNVPENLYYTDTHEWVKVEGDTAILGVTDHAQEAMGDMVYVDLPEVGTAVEPKGDCGVLESVKSASDFYAPVTGEIVEVNSALTDTPDLVNKDPYGDGWLVKIKLANPKEVKKLLDAKGYQAVLDAE